MMEELLIKVKDEKESSFIKDLLKKLRIQFETIGENEGPPGKEVKQSVIDGQLAYKNGETDQFTKIDRKDLWK
ncbi:MAG: hypothetical protein ACHQIM_22710 [Sphingobacteriales bacterium]